MRLGRSFGWLWAAYAVSAYGSGLALGAFGLIAVVVLHAGPAEVAAVAAAGLAVGAVVAVPLGPWVERRRKRPVMITTDLVRCGVLATVPLAFALGALTVAQLVLVAVVTSAAKIAFNAAAGAYLRTLVAPGQLIVATSRFEATTWTATILGPPLGGAAIGLLGPVTTVAADGASHLLSAAGVAAIPAPEPPPAGSSARHRVADLLAGWRHLLAHPALRALLANAALVNGLIMAGEPLIAVLMLGRLGFAPWQYGVAFGVPCVGGLVAARLAPRLVARYGAPRVLRAAGTLRACWPIALAAVGSGAGGLVLVVVVQLGLVASCGLFNPVLAARRLELTPADRTARMLTAWSVTTSAAIAGLTAVWGVLAEAVGPRAALALAGAVLLASPALLPRARRAADPPGGTVAARLVR